jgi:hypothetical protein
MTSPAFRIGQSERFRSGLLTPVEGARNPRPGKISVTH